MDLSIDTHCISVIESHCRYRSHHSWSADDRAPELPPWAAVPVPRHAVIEPKLHNSRTTYIYIYNIDIM